MSPIATPLLRHCVKAIRLPDQTIPADQLIGVVDRTGEKIRLQEERQRMVDELASAKDTAELASTSKTEFLTRLSGELGDQFTTIVKLSAIIAEQKLGPIENEDYSKCATGISDGCRRLSRIMLWIGELGQLESAPWLSTMPSSISNRQCRTSPMSSAKN